MIVQQKKLLVTFKYIIQHQKCHMDKKMSIPPQQIKAFKTLISKYDEPKWQQISTILQHKFTDDVWTKQKCKQMYIYAYRRWGVVKKQQKGKNQQRKWTVEEDKLLFLNHQRYGNKWKQISEQMSSRSINEVKNRFYSLLRKKLRILNKRLFNDKNSTRKIKNIRPSVIQKFLRSSLSINGIDQFKQMLTRQTFNNDNLSQIQVANFKSIILHLFRINQNQENCIKFETTQPTCHDPIAKRIRGSTPFKNQKTNISIQCEDLLLQDLPNIQQIQNCTIEPRQEQDHQIFSFEYLRNTKQLFQDPVVPLPLNYESISEQLQNRQFELKII